MSRVFFNNNTLKYLDDFKDKLPFNNKINEFKNFLKHEKYDINDICINDLSIHIFKGTDYLNNIKYLSSNEKILNQDNITNENKLLKDSNLIVDELIYNPKIIFGLKTSKF